MTEHAPPQYIEEVEALLENSFPEEEPGLIVDDEAVGFQRFIYRGGLRVLANARRDDREIARNEPGYVGEEWTESWEITTRKIAQIAFRYERQATFLSRQLSLINGARRYIDNHWPELEEHLYPDQQLYVLDIVDSLQKSPESVLHEDDLGQAHRTNVPGVTVIAPTGSGKSHLIAVCARLLSAGQPLSSSTSGERPGRIVLVAPSLVIQEQLATMLRERLPDVRTGILSGYERDTDADIVISTIAMFNSNFEDGHIDGNPVDAVMIDEAHQLVEPKFRQTFLEQWHGITVCFTATPAYNAILDVRHTIPREVERTDILTLMDEGRLNNGQLFSFAIDQEAHNILRDHYQIDFPQDHEKYITRDVIDSLVIDFVRPFLEEGRRGIIFCEQGEQAVYAKRLAARLRAVKLTSGDYVTAEAMSSYERNQHAVMSAYRQRKLQVVTTVDTGRQGLDAEFDFVIINCNLISRLRGRQIVGRGTRLSDRFPVTVYAQFSNLVNRDSSHGNILFSIEEAFGADRKQQIQQGLILRKSVDSSRKRIPPAADANLFLPIVSAMLDRIDHQPLGVVYVGRDHGNRAVQEGAVSLQALLDGYVAHEIGVRTVLHEAGFEWQGRFEDTDEGPRLVRYYPPEARAVIEEKFPKGMAVKRANLPKHFGESKKLIDFVLSNPEYDITSREMVFGEKATIAPGYEEPELNKIRIALQTLPGRNPDDMGVTALSRELGISPDTVKTWAGVDDKVRFYPERIGFPLTAAEVKKVREKFDAHPVAEPGEMTLRDIARAAGVSYHVAKKNISDEERSRATQKRYTDSGGTTRWSPFWLADESQVLVERMRQFKPQKLPAHLIPAEIIIRRLLQTKSIDRGKIKELLNNGGFVKEEILLAGGRNPSHCISWAAIAYLGKMTNKTIDLDYSRLPIGPDDLDSDKIAYAQEIQRRFVVADRLQDYTERDLT